MPAKYVDGEKFRKKELALGCAVGTAMSKATLHCPSGAPGHSHVWSSLALEESTAKGRGADPGRDKSPE